MAGSLSCSVCLPHCHRLVWEILLSNFVPPLSDALAFCMANNDFLEAHAANSDQTSKETKSKYVRTSSKRTNRKIRMRGVQCGIAQVITDTCSAPCRHIMYTRLLFLSIHILMFSS